MDACLFVCLFVCFVFCSRGDRRTSGPRIFKGEGHMIMKKIKEIL